MTTIPVTARTAAAVVEAARLASPQDSTCVTWGLPGAGHDGFDILAANDDAAVERLRRAVEFGRGRIHGKAGHRVLWGTHADVIKRMDAEAKDAGAW